MPSSSDTVSTSITLKVKDTVHIAAMFLLCIVWKYFHLNRTAQYYKICCHKQFEDLKSHELFITEK